MTGLMERYAIVRHRLGAYTGFTFGCRFTSKLSDSTDLNDRAIQLLFRQLIRKHEALRCRLVWAKEKRVMETSTLTIEEIDSALKHIIQVQKVADASQIVDMETEAHRLHVQRFFDLSEPHPLWRVRVLKCRDNENITFSFIFLFHHVIADGRSSVALSRDLFRLLQGEPMTESFGLTPPIEKLTDTRITWQMLLFQVIPELFIPRFVRDWIFGKDIYWTGDTGTILPRTDTFIRGGLKASKTILVRSQWPNIDRLLEYCRREKTTVHAALSYCFTRSLQDLTQQPIRCGHAMSLRPYTGIPDDRMAVHVTGVKTDHNRIDPPTWNSIRLLQQTLNRNKEAGVRLLGLMSFLGQDDDSWCQAFIRMHSDHHHGRSGSICISNLGSVSIDAPGPWKWDNASFSNDANLIAETLNTTVVTCRGTLDVMVSATKGTVEEDFILEFLDKSKNYLDQLIN